MQVLVLLTDGRVDAYQAHEVCWRCRICFAGSWQPAANKFHSETSADSCGDCTQTSHVCMQARNAMERLVNKQQDTSLHAFGVGRGVDKVRLLSLHMCAATMPCDAICSDDVVPRLSEPLFVAVGAGIQGELISLQVELLHIIAACGTGDPEERYMGLRVLDEHPW